MLTEKQADYFIDFARIIEERYPIIATQTYIAEMSGVSQGTVSNMMAVFIEKGLFDKLENGVCINKAGRDVLQDLNSRVSCAVCADTIKDRNWKGCCSARCACEFYD